MASHPDTPIADPVGGTPRRLYRRNFSAGLIHGVFFQAADAFSNINTVLPAFVATLTASTIAVGLMAAVQGIGEVLPQMFTAYRIEDRPYQKPILLWIITLRWVSWAFIAVVTVLFALEDPLLVLALLIGLFSAFSLAGGVGTVVYADVFAKAIPARRRGRFTGLKQLLGYGAAIAAGWIVAWILSQPARFPYPTNYALIFGLASVALLVAFVGFAMIKEPPGSSERRSHDLATMLRTSWRLARINPNFRRLLIGRGLTQARLFVAPFFALYAVTDVGVASAAVGLYLVAQMTGAAVSNLLWGWMGDRHGNRAVIIGTSITGMLAPASALLVPVVGAPVLYATFFLTGVTMSGMRLGYPNIILEMASPELRATCVALQNTLLAPIALVPLFIGAISTFVPFPFVFAIAAATMVAALVASIVLRDPRTDPEGACIT